MMKGRFFGIPAVVLAAALVLGAGEPGKDAPAAVPTTPVGQTAAVVGENYCLGCALKKAQGAAAQCSKYGHRHVLKVESATGADGKAIDALKGESLHYLDNDKSEPLIKGEKFHKKRIEVKGRLFGPERAIEVTDFKAI